MTQLNRQIILAELPSEKLAANNFQVQTAPIPSPGPGEVLCKVLLLSLDPANRAWMNGPTYRSALQAGDVMAGGSLARVIESNSARLKVGDLVQADGGWQDYYVQKASQVSKRPSIEPLSYAISILGSTGLTAYYGMIGIGKPRPGDTVVVSAAGGATGSVAGQLAKLAGAKVVGIAGGAEKCARVVEEFGFDACVDYRNGNLFKLLKAACPDGIDVYFDNVGGAVLEAVLGNMNLYGRVVCCGSVSQYDTRSPTAAPRSLPGILITKRLTMQGFIVFDDPILMAEANRKLLIFARDGRIKVAEDIIDGLENAPQGLVGLLHGDNFGKRMIRVSD